jgi:hypothetical protein
VRTIQRAIAFFRRKGYITTRRRYNSSLVYQITARFFALIRGGLEQASTKTAVWLRQKLGIATAWASMRAGFAIGGVVTGVFQF